MGDKHKYFESSTNVVEKAGITNFFCPLYQKQSVRVDKEIIETVVEELLVPASEETTKSGRFINVEKVFCMVEEPDLNNADLAGRKYTKLLFQIQCTVLRLVSNGLSF